MLAGTAVAVKFFMNLKPAIDRQNAFIADKEVTPEKIQNAKAHAESLANQYLANLKEFSALKDSSLKNLNDSSLQEAVETARQTALGMKPAVEQAAKDAGNLQKQFDSRPRGFLAQCWETIENGFNFAKEALKGPLNLIGDAGHFLSQNPWAPLLFMVIYNALNEMAKLERKMNEKANMGSSDLANAAIDFIVKTAKFTAITVAVSAFLDKWLSQLGQNGLFESMAKAWPVAQTWVIVGAVAMGVGAISKRLLETFAAKEPAAPKIKQQPPSEPNDDQQFSKN